MPYVDQQDDSVFGAIVPYLVIVGIVQYYCVVLLVGPYRSSDADPAPGQSCFGVDLGPLVVDNDWQVDAQAKIGRCVVGGYLGTRTEIAKKDEPKGRAFEQLVVVLFAPESIVTKYTCLFIINLGEK